MGAGHFTGPLPFFRVLWGRGVLLVVDAIQSRKKGKDTTRVDTKGSNESDLQPAGGVFLRTKGGGRDDGGGNGVVIKSVNDRKNTSLLSRVGRVG